MTSNIQTSETASEQGGGKSKEGFVYPGLLLPACSEDVSLVWIFEVIAFLKDYASALTGCSRELGCIEIFLSGFEGHFAAIAGGCRRHIVTVFDNDWSDEMLVLVIHVLNESTFGSAGNRHEVEHGKVLNGFTKTDSARVWAYPLAKFMRQ